MIFNKFQLRQQQVCIFHYPTVRYKIQFLMIQKEELISILLQNRCTYASEDSDSIEVDYERNKDELIAELLTFNTKKHMRTQHAKKSKQPTIKINFNKTQPIPTEPFQFIQKQPKKGEQSGRISLNDYFSKQKKEERSEIYLNQYFKSTSSKEIIQQNQELQNLERIIENSAWEGQNILNRFLVGRAVSGEKYEESQHMVENRMSCLQVCQKAENKSYNESTLVMSKYKKQSPHKSLRVTQRSVKSKSSSKQHSRKSPFKLSISKVSEIEIRGATYGSIRQNIKKDLSNDFSLTPKSQIKRNLTYSMSNINKTQNVASYPEDIEPFSTSKSNLLELLKPKEEKPEKNLQETQQTQANLIHEDRLIRSVKNNQNERVIRIKLDLLEEREEDESVEVTNFDYDKQPNIFDNISHSSKPPLPLQHSKPAGNKKIGFSEIKDVWHIKDKSKFKEEIKMQKQLFQRTNQKEIEKKPSTKDNIKIFDKSPQSHFAVTHSQIPRKNKKQEKEKEEQQPTEQGFHFINFLKAKLTTLVKKQEQKPQFKSKQGQNDIKAIQSKKEQKSKNGSNSKEISMRAQPSQLSKQPSQSSFFKQKKYIEEKGYKNVDVANIVGQSVKIVSINLDKITKKITNQSSHSSNNAINLREDKKQNSDKNSNNLKKNEQSIANDKKQSENSFVERDFVKNSCSSKPKSIKLYSNELLEHSQSICQRQKEGNLSVDFFGGSQLRERDSSYSKPSTVQKHESNSDDKSELLNQLNFSSHKEDQFNQQLNFSNHSGDQINLQLFPRIQSEEREETIISQHSLKSVTKKFQGNSQSELNPSFKTSIVQQSKPIEINNKDLKQISLSQDAISFSKLQNASFNLSGDTEAQVQLAKQKIINTQFQKKNSHEPIQIKVDLKEEIKKQGPKPGKVRKIEINLDESSSEDELYEQEVQSQGIDMEAIEDYDSDEQPVKNSNPSKQKPPAVLPPVIEEDLQESELFKNHFKPNITLRLKSEGSEKRSIQIKDLQDQFLKDCPLDRAESEVQKYTNGVTFKKNSFSQDNPQKQKIRIKLKPTESKLTNLEESKKQYDLHSHLLDVEEKQLLNSLKNDVDKLKNKIESSVILDTSKIYDQTSKNNISYNVKKISIDMNQPSQNGKSSSMSKYFREDSSILTEKTKKEELSSQQNRENKKIDFDQINENGGKQLFKEFREDLKSLKKKMVNDVFNDL